MLLVVRRADADGDHLDRVRQPFADAHRLFQGDRVERIDHERNVLDRDARAVGRGDDLLIGVGDALRGDENLHDADGHASQRCARRRAAASARLDLAVVVAGHVDALLLDVGAIEVARHVEVAVGLDRLAVVACFRRRG